MKPLSIRNRLLVLALASGLANSAVAQNTVFLPTNGNWNAAANWSLGSVPTAAQNPIIHDGRVATVDANVGTCGSVFVGQAVVANARGTVSFRPGAMLAAANVLLGRDSTNFGQFNQGGGVLSVAGYVSVGDAAGGGTGARGEYNLSGGLLQMTGPGSFVLVGNQGVGRMLLAGSAVLNTPSLSVGNTAGSSGSQFLQWGGALNVGDLNVGSSTATNCAFTISAGTVQWGGLLTVRDTLTLQGQQFWMQRTNAGGVGLQITDSGVLRFELDARGIAPLRLAGSTMAIAPGSKLVVDGTRYTRWTATAGRFLLVQHGGYAGEPAFAPANVTFTGFGDLTPSLVYSSNAIELVLTAPTNGVPRLAQGIFCEYWELPINNDSINRGKRILAPLTALPSFTNTLVVTHPVFGRPVANVNLDARRRDTNYFMRFTGYLAVPTNGSYTLYLRSDDGSRLWLNDRLLINNDGAHSATEVSGTTNLTAGLHKLVVGYFQNTSSAVLELRWAGPGFAKQFVPDTALFLTAEPEGWMRQPTYQNITFDHELLYNYAPSFMYDETEGLYKIWMCAGVNSSGDFIGYKESTSLTGLLTAPLQITLTPSGDPTKFDQIHACDPNVYRVGDLYYLTYSGNTDNTQLPERTRVGMAVSYDRGRTFQRLHGGVHILEPNTNTFVVDPNSYGVGQSAVVQANDGYFYMIYTDADGGGAPVYQRVIRSLDPAFTPGSFTAVTSMTNVGNSVDLAYDPARAEFIVINHLEMIYFNATWTEVRRRYLSNPFAWTFGEGHGLLMDSQKRPFTFLQDGVPCDVVAAATVEDPANTSLWAYWVEGDLKYLVVPRAGPPTWGNPKVISEGRSFAGDAGSVLMTGTVLSLSNNFTVDFWARPTQDIGLPGASTNGAPGTSNQRYVVQPDIGGVWGDGHAGMGVSVGRNGIGVFEHAGGYLPSLLSWPSVINDWVHVTVVYTNKTPQLYVNGRRVAGGLTSPQTYVHPSVNWFGGSVYGYYEGQAWNFRVWNRPLDAGEIASLPDFADAGGLTSAFVGQWLQDTNLSQGSLAGAKVVDAAVAGGSVDAAYTFQLADNGGGRFTINPTNGLVTVQNAALLNFATNTLQPFAVRAVPADLLPVERNFSVLVLATNDPPVIAAMPSPTVMAGTVLNLTTPASDPDVPPQSLLYSLLIAPSGATVDPGTGQIQWRPTLAQAGTTHLFQVRVSDQGAPPLAASRNFSVTVLQPTAPTVSSVALTNGQFALQVSGDVGPDYVLLASTNLVNWRPLSTNTPTSMPLWLADPGAAQHPQRFYRLQLGP